MAEWVSYHSLAGEQQRLREILADRNAYHWEIEIDSRVVGNINLNHIAETSTEFDVHAAALTYLLGEPQLWGRGITTGAARAVLAWSSRDGGFEAIKARIVPQNLASIAVATKLGFLPLGQEPYGVNPEISHWNVYRLDLI